MCRLQETGVPRCPCNEPGRRSVTRRARAAAVRAVNDMPVAETSAVLFEPMAEPLTVWNVEEIREVAALIVVASEYPMLPAGTDDDVVRAAGDAYNAARKRLFTEFGGAHRAAIAVGRLVAGRATELSGVDAELVAAAWAERERTAVADSERHAAIVEEARVTARAAGETMTPREPFDRYSAAYSLAGRVRAGSDPETTADMRQLSDGYQQALAEIRPFGGTLNFETGSQPKAVKEFAAVAELYPSDWIDASNAYARPLLAKYSTKRAHYGDVRAKTEKVEKQTIQLRTLTAEKAAQAADTAAGPWTPTGDTGAIYEQNSSGLIHRVEALVYERPAWHVIYPGQEFRAKKDGTPWGTGWEKWVHPETNEVSWRQPYTRIATEQVVGQYSEILVGSLSYSRAAGRTGDFGTAAHELAHRAEYSVGAVTALERAFLLERTQEPDPDWEGHTRQQALEPIRAHVKGQKRSTEVCYPDRFADRYMGRDYGENRSATEILSMGMESMFTGTHGGLIGIGKYDTDLEYRDMVLGILATAGGRKEAIGAGWFG